MLYTTDALDVAVSVIEDHGLEVQDPIEGAPNLRGFGFPNPLLGGMSQAIVRDISRHSVIEISIQLTQGQVQPVLRDGLLQLLNGLHFEFPAVVFTYENDEVNGDEIELTTCIPYLDSEHIAPIIEDRLTRLQEVHQRSLPILMTYLTQRLRVRYNSIDGVTAAYPSVSVLKVLELLETGQYGSA